MRLGRGRGRQRQERREVHVLNASSSGSWVPAELRLNQPKENCLMRSRIVVRFLGLAVALVLSILAVQPSEAVGCFNNKLVIYYSDASHTTEVGRCEPTCC